MNHQERRYNLRQMRTYSWEQHERDDLLRMQGGRCLICGAAPKPGMHLCTDHDHSAGFGVTGDRGPIRGLLCGRCNLVLGQVGDNPALLVWMARYLIYRDSAVEWVPTTIPDLRGIPDATLRELLTVRSDGESAGRDDDRGGPSEPAWERFLLESALRRSLGELLARQQRAMVDRVFGKRGRQMARHTPRLEVSRVFSLGFWQAETFQQLRSWHETVVVTVMVRRLGQDGRPDMDRIQRGIADCAERLARRLTLSASARLRRALAAAASMTEDEARGRIAAVFEASQRVPQIAARETQRASCYADALVKASVL
jgi:hypothetical protein